MNLQELEALVKHHDSMKKQGFRNHDAYAAALVLTRSKAPTGLKVSTPFGLCQILNCVAENGSYRTYFAVSRQQLIRTISKSKLEHGKVGL